MVTPNTTRTLSFVFRPVCPAPGSFIGSPLVKFFGKRDGSLRWRHFAPKFVVSSVVDGVQVYKTTDLRGMETHHVYWKKLTMSMAMASIANW